jgi:beta-glucanase (GH16 family)
MTATSRRLSLTNIGMTIILVVSVAAGSWLLFGAASPGTARAATPAASVSAGYSLVASDGGIFSFGDAAFQGSTGNIALNRPIVGMAPTPDGQGYWLVASDGGIFSFGDAAFHGSTGNIHLNKPIVGMAATPDGQGYWLVASDGGIFSFGDASFYGSSGAIALNKPIVGMAATPDGQGYWLVASDGGIFSFGDAAFDGSTGNIHLNKPIVGMAATPDGGGYWLVASDGGIFSFGDAAFSGSAGSIALNKPIVGMAAAPSDGGPNTFDDEFTGPAGSGPNEGLSRPVWYIDGCWTEGCGHESPTEYSSSNAYLDGQGDLVLEADPGSSASCGFAPCQYRSAGLTMHSTFHSDLSSWSQLYGTFSARIKVPTGQGLWPAFWLTGTNESSASWPMNGEIDAMESYGGNRPRVVQQHLVGASGLRSGSWWLLPPGESVSDWHTYSVTWSPTEIVWQVDGATTQIITEAEAGPAWAASFEHPFDIFLDLEVGGSDVGSPDASTVFPAKMLIDWVRVSSN